MDTDETTTGANNDDTTSGDTDTEAHALRSGRAVRPGRDANPADDDTEAHLYVPKDERGGQDDTEGHGRFRG